MKSPTLANNWPRCNRCFCAALFIAGACWLGQAGGQTLYISDKLGVPLYRAASTTSAVVVQLAIGSAVERFGAGDAGWSNVAYRNKQGWVETRFLTPDAGIVGDYATLQTLHQNAQRKVARLEAEIAQLEKRHDAATAENAALKAQNFALNQRIARLSRASSATDSVFLAAARAEQNLAFLRIQNDILAESANNASRKVRDVWFLAAWLIASALVAGIVVGRWQMRRRNYLYVDD